MSRFQLTREGQLARTLQGRFAGPVLLAVSHKEAAVDEPAVVSHAVAGLTKLRDMRHCCGRVTDAVFIPGKPTQHNEKKHAPLGSACSARACPRPSSLRRLRRASWRRQGSGPRRRGRGALGGAGRRWGASAQASPCVVNRVQPCDKETVMARLASSRESFVVQPSTSCKCSTISASATFKVKRMPGGAGPAARGCRPRPRWAPRRGGIAPELAQAATGSSGIWAPAMARLFLSSRQPAILVPPAQEILSQCSCKGEREREIVYEALCNRALH